MAQVDRQHYALQTIFSFFLGLMVVAVIGVGVNTFYQSPATTYQKQLQPLYDRQSVLSAKGGVETSATAAEMSRLESQIRSLQLKQTADEAPWMVNTSIILVLFATVVMGVSLVRSDQLRVLSNGLLLGGLFTMVYGSGWVIASQSSLARFLVVLFALAVAIALGYLKFVRLRAVPTSPVAAGEVVTAAAGTENIGDLERRVASLEDRLAAVAGIIAPSQGGDRSAR